MAFKSFLKGSNKDIMSYECCFEFGTHLASHAEGPEKGRCHLP